jgi:hypothetical protein
MIIVWLEVRVLPAPPRIPSLQDGLGDLNDIAVHEKTIAAMSVHHQRSDPSRVFAAGLLAGREDARVEASITAANEAYLDLARVKRFWR